MHSRNNLLAAPMYLQSSKGNINPRVHLCVCVCVCLHTTLTEWRAERGHQKHRPQFSVTGSLVNSYTQGAKHITHVHIHREHEQLAHADDLQQGDLAVT